MKTVSHSITSCIDACEVEITYRHHGQGRRRGKTHSGRRSLGREEGTPAHRRLKQNVSANFGNAYSGYRSDLPRPKTTVYAPRMMELQVPVRKLLIPPSTMNTPTAILTRRLHSINTISQHLRETDDIQDVCEIHCDGFVEENLR